MRSGKAEARQLQPEINQEAVKMNQKESDQLESESTVSDEISIQPNSKSKFKMKKT